MATRVLCVCVRTYDRELHQVCHRQERPGGEEAEAWIRPSRGRVRHPAPLGEPSSCSCGARPAGALVDWAWHCKLLSTHPLFVARSLEAVPCTDHFQDCSVAQATPNVAMPI